LLGVFAWLALPMRPASAELPPSVATIQSQIDAAPEGGTVTIAAGTYTDSLTINKSITLTGVTSATTIIQAVTGQRVITVTDGHDLRLTNLSLTNGNQQNGSSLAGGGVWLAGGSLWMTDTRVANNGGSWGGGIFQAGASGRVDIVNSFLENNSTPNHGGAIYAEGNVFLTNTQVLSNTAGGHGGGIHVESGFTSLAGGLFSNNRATGDNGGAVNANNGLSIAGTRFISNTAPQKGGAVLLSANGYPAEVTGAYFERNRTVYTGTYTSVIPGGGALWANGNVTVSGSTFLTNSVHSSNSRTSAGGGAVYVLLGSLWLDSSLFKGNGVDSVPFTTPGGGAVTTNGSYTTVRNSEFEGNHAFIGGALNVSSTPFAISGSTFRGNKASYGGALIADGGTVSTSLFAENTATDMAGAIWVSHPTSVMDSRFTGNTTGGIAGTIYSCDRLNLVNVAIVGSSSVWGAEALQLDGSETKTINQVTINGGASGKHGPAIWLTGGSLAITNSIIASYTMGISQTGGSATLNGGLWWGGTALHTGIGPYSELAVLSAAPAFTPDGYHLTIVSPAIDHGVDSGVLTDIDGNPRPLGAGYDVGADEYPLYLAYLPLAQRQ
jgi:predicted outer membrane repeat protein